MFFRYESVWLIVFASVYSSNHGESIGNTFMHENVDDSIIYDIFASIINIPYSLVMFGIDLVITTILSPLIIITYPCYYYNK